MRKLLVLALVCLASHAGADEVLDRLLEYQSKSVNLSYALDACQQEKALMTVNASDYYLRYLDCSAELSGFDVVLNGSEGNLSLCRGELANVSGLVSEINSSFQNVSAAYLNLSGLVLGLQENLSGCQAAHEAREREYLEAELQVRNYSMTVQEAQYQLTACTKQIDTTCPNMRDAMLVYYPKWRRLSGSARDCLPKMMLVGGFQNLEAISQACNIAKQNSAFGMTYSPEAMNIIMEYNSAGLLDQQNISGQIFYQVKNFGGGCIAAFKDKEQETADLTDKAFITDAVMWNVAWVFILLVCAFAWYERKKRVKQ